MPTSAVTDPARSAPRASSSRLRFSVRAWLRIHRIIEVTVATAIRAMAGLERLLGPGGEVAREHLEGDRSDQAERDRSQDSQGHPAKRVATTLGQQEGGDDPDDERCLDAFPKADDEGGQHPASLLSGTPNEFSSGARTPRDESY